MQKHPNKLELFVRRPGYNIEEHDIVVANTRVPAKGPKVHFRAFGLFLNLQGKTDQ